MEDIISHYKARKEIFIMPKLTNPILAWLICLKNIIKVLTFRNTIIIIQLVVYRKEEKSVSPRTGRPKSKNPKNVDVKVRFDEESNNRLLQYCKEHEITKTEAIRKAVDLLIRNEKE